MKKGSLVVVGTGIKTVGQVTLEAHAWIKQAEKVLHSVADPVTEEWINRINPSAESLNFRYDENKPLQDIYEEMVERILECLCQGLRVCAVFYGHPGVFVFASHESIRRAHQLGFEATMLPGVSAIDCLFADLGLDPVETGCQIFEATDFLIYKRTLNTSSMVLLLQVGFVGETRFKKAGFEKRYLHVLVDVLQEYYKPDHEVVVYEAAQYPLCEPTIKRMPLAKISKAEVNAVSTLYIPPIKRKELDQDMLKRLGISL